MRRPAAAVLMLAALACTKGKPAAPPAAPAAVTQPAASLPAVELERFELPNGLDVILHVDPKMPAVNVNLWYHVGSKDEEPGRTGLAHLFEHMMFQGSKNVKGEYLSLAERAGANLKAGGVNGTTDQDRTNYFETVPTSSLEYALWLESDRMGFLLDAVDQAALDNQRNVVMNEKRQGDNRPYATQRYIVAASLYPPGHPYAHAVIGSMDDLQRVGLEDVKAFFRTYYAPNNASLAITGSFDKDQAKELVKRYFAALPPGEPTSRVKAWVPTLDTDRVVIRKERAPAAKLTLVWHAPEYFHKDEAPLDVAARILGDEKSSRLYRKLVRDGKVASKLAAYEADGEIASALYVEVLLAPDASLDQVRDLVLAEVKDLATKGPTDAEVAQQKARVEYDWVSGLERIGGFGGKGDLLNRYNTFLGDPDRFKADYDRYAAVTKADVQRVVKEWLVDRKRLEIRFVPETPEKQEVAELDRTKEPSMAGKVPFSVPPLEKRTLANGLEVYVASRPGLPKVETALIVKRGDLAETEANAGTSYMTAVSVNVGTKTRTAEKVEEELAGLGASLQPEGSKFGSALALSALKRNLDPALALLADVALSPTFPDGEVELAKKLRLDQLKQEQANPAVLAGELFPRILFAGGHPGGVPDRGTAASIAALTRADLVRNHQTFWAPNNAAVLMVGDVTADEAEALVKKHFGAWAAHDVPAAAVTAPGLPSKPYVFLVDAPGASQSQVRIGSVAPARRDPDYVALQVANGLLGGTFSSRLNLNLREDKGYSYGAYSSVTQNAYFGYWAAGAGVQTSATVAALIEFKKEIDGLAGGVPVSDAELAGLKKNLSRSYLQNFETLSQLVRQVAPLITAGVSPDFLSAYIPDVLQVTAEGAAATARKHLPFERSVVLVVGDLSIIEQPILTLGWGDVLVLSQEGKLLRRGGQPAAQQPAAPETPAASAPVAQPASAPRPAGVKP